MVANNLQPMSSMKITKNIRKNSNVGSFWAIFPATEIKFVLEMLSLWQLIM